MSSASKLVVPNAENIPHEEDVQQENMLTIYNNVIDTFLQSNKTSSESEAPPTQPKFDVFTTLYMSAVDTLQLNQYTTTDKDTQHSMYGDMCNQYSLKTSADAGYMDNVMNMLNYNNDNAATVPEDNAATVPENVTDVVNTEAVVKQIGLYITYICVYIKYICIYI